MLESIAIDVGMMRHYASPVIIDRFFSTEMCASLLNEATRNPVQEATPIRMSDVVYQESHYGTTCYTAVFECTNPVIAEELQAGCTFFYADKWKWTEATIILFISEMTDNGKEITIVVDHHPCKKFLRNTCEIASKLNPLTCELPEALIPLTKDLHELEKFVRDTELPAFDPDDPNDENDEYTSKELEKVSEDVSKLADECDKYIPDILEMLHITEVNKPRRHPTGYEVRGAFHNDIQPYCDCPRVCVGNDESGTVYYTFRVHEPSFPASMDYYNKHAKTITAGVYHDTTAYIINVTWNGCIIAVGLHK